MKDSKSSGETESLGSGYTRKDGIIYGPDGKPCRQCNSLKDLMNLNNGSDPSSTTSSSSLPFSFSKRPKVDPKPSSSSDSPLRSAQSEDELSTPPPKAPFDPTNCPPDVELLGRSTWTFLHTMAASYPARPTPTEQSEMSQFLRTFALFFPCYVCAQDLRVWMARRENTPVLDRGWAGLGQWMCRAHNEVNEKLGKPTFDCNLWRQRWKDGFKDGRCDP